MGKYFGTDGFRGEANFVLTAERAFAVGRFVGAAHRGQEILIGRDTRRSSPMLEQALAAGLTASGANVCLPGVLPTPAVSFAVKQLGFGGGVMISASHNPYTDNGIKLFDGKGEKPTDAALEALEDYLDGGAAEPPLAHGREIGTVHGAPEVAEAYLSYLRDAVKGNFKGLRVGLDTANGSAAAMAPSLFRALGATVTAIHTAPDGCNINRACGSTHLHDLAASVDRINADCVPKGGVKIDNMVAAIDEGTRSFKVRRAKPDGKSYARDIAEKYGLSFDKILTKIEKNKQ